MKGRLRWWGLGIGALGGVLDTGLFLALGIDFEVAGRDMTGFVAAYLAVSFAALCFGIGWLADARAQARRDAETIDRQLGELRATQRAVLQNEKLAAIGRLAAGVAHEVRNPLGVIRASASMVQESFEPGDEPHQACRFICEESDRLNGLITSLLTFARPTEPRLETVSLEKVMERALQLASADLERRGVEVVREGSGAPPDLRGDPDLLAQVVLGLLTNAAEAIEGADPADPTRRIALRLHVEGGAAVLEVADSGPGITLEDAEKIFEPFFTTKPTGTGLGLAMTARIVDAHAGQLEVLQGRGAGAQGRGACFRLRVPLDGPAAARDRRESA